MAVARQIITNAELLSNHLSSQSYKFIKVAKGMDSSLHTSTRLTRREREILGLMAQNLSNNEIAEHLVISIQTVRWYVKELYSKLDVHNRDEAIAKVEALTFRLSQHQPDPSHNLPARVTTFVGREQELMTIRSILLHSETRLLTLIGTAGIGKTRLSLETAYPLLDTFPDGVTFIDLAPLNDPALIVAATAQALGLAESETGAIMTALKNTLYSRRALLIFDNFEHVLDAASLIAELISAAPNLKVLVTSRESLNLYAEQQYLVPSLSLAVDAVRLFEQRAKSVDSAFLLTSENTAIVSQICSKLDGVPLAIELAAARIRLFPPPLLLSRLNKSLSLLTGGARDLVERHRTLRGAIDWSYQLLNDDEKRLFRRLGIFAGGWAPEALEAIGAPDLKQDVYEVFDSLIAKSLIKLMAGSNEESRFIMLETLREFALEQLSAAGELEYARSLHASYFLEVAKTILPLGFNRHGTDFLRNLNIELENFHLALDYLHETDGMAAQEMTMVGALGRFWWERGRINDMLSRSLAAISRDEEAISPEIRAGAYAMLSFACGGSYQNELAMQSAEIALALARQAESPYWMARALVTLSACNPLSGGNERRLQLARESLELLPQLEHPSVEIPLLEVYIFALEAMGEMDQAAEMSDRMLMLAKRYDDYRTLNIGLQRRVLKLRDAGDDVGSYSAAVEGLEIARHTDNRRMILSFLSLHALASMKLERLGEARQLTNELLKLSAFMNIPAELSIAHQTDCLLAQKEGDITRVKDSLRQALENGKEVDLLDFRLISLLCFAEVFIILGNDALAAQIYGTVEQSCRNHSLDRGIVFSTQNNTTLEAARTTLNIEVFEQLYAAGAAMSPKSAWALALNYAEHI